MLVSILIPTYKDVQALELIFKALLQQTYTNFEVIVAEDDVSDEVKYLISLFHSRLRIKHVFHEDKGNRKAIIMNKALLKASGEYLIFIDGDTIPFSRFIDAHITLSEESVVLCGRRVNLGDKVSKELREKVIDSAILEKKFFRKYSYFNTDNIRHYEQGIYLNPKSFLYKFVRSLNYNVHILASNFSCFKKDIFIVNGFDEGLPFAPNRDDTDLEWRMLSAGFTLKSCTFSANLFHLNHSRTDRKDEGEANMKIIREKQKKNEYIAKIGIIND